MQPRPPRIQRLRLTFGNGARARLHAIAFAGGLLVLALGILGWALDGGPTTIGDLVVVLDLTVGGTILLTSALVGRARAAEARRDAQMRVLQLAAKRMSASLTPEAVGRAVVEETRSVIDYHNARIHLLVQPDDLVPIAFEGEIGTSSGADMQILRARVGVGFTGWVAKHGAAIRVDDAVADPRGVIVPGTLEVDESVLVVPMQHDEGLIGVITLSRLGLHRFDDDDLRLLSIMADQAATAFSSAAHLAQTRHLATELRQLLDMSSALSRSLDPRDVANLIAEHLARAVGASQAQISDWDRADDRLRTLGCFPAGQREAMKDYYPLEGFPLTRSVLRDGVLAMVDVADPNADPAEVALLLADGMRGLVMLPLIVKGEAIGLVELVSPTRPSSDPERITLVRTMAHEAAMALENARLYETARNLADRDPLTGFFNHRYLHERLSEEVVRAVRTRRQLSVLMLDLDDFKLVNDTFGHVYGDGVLVHVAERIRATLRASDIAARYGGDEFAVVLPETGLEEARGVAERILAALAAVPFRADGRAPLPIGISVGVAAHPAHGRSATALISAADVGLYASKGAGGSRVSTGSMAGVDPPLPGGPTLGPGGPAGA